jgi:hypothetical protein
MTMGSVSRSPAQRGRGSLVCQVHVETIGLAIGDHVLPQRRRNRDSAGSPRLRSPANASPYELIIARSKRAVNLKRPVPRGRRISHVWIACRHNLSWPKIHIRSRFVLGRLAVGCESGCRSPVDSCDRHSAPVRCWRWLTLDEALPDSLPRVCPVRSHSTSWLATIPADVSIRPAQGSW